MDSRIPNPTSKGSNRYKIPAIIIDSINRGGIGDSIYQGIKYSVANLVGFDIHSRPGVLLVNQKMTIESLGPNGIVQTTDTNQFTGIFGATGTNEEKGQFFKAPSNQIISVILKLTKQGTPTDNFIVSIVSALDGTAVGSVTVAASTISNNAENTFTFSSPLVTVTGNPYYIQLSRDGSRDATNYIGVIINFNSLIYTPGAMWTRNSGVWSSAGTDATSNFHFQVISLIPDLYKILPCSDGNIYLFGKTTGKVYKNASGTYTLLGTVAPAAGAVGILDACEYNGNIYYAMQSRLGQWTFASAFSTRSDSFGTFSGTNDSFHPMVFVPRQQKLFIGDNQYIAQVDLTGTFTAIALTLASPFQVSCLGISGSALVIGTRVNKGVAIAQILVWDTYSVAPNNSDYINEVEINAIIPAHDIILVNAGVNGNIYYYDTQTLQLIKQIPGTYDNNNQGRVYYPAVANSKGIPIFGFSAGATNFTLGNPASQGIYSYGMRNISLPRVLALEYPISTGNLNNITIWSVAIKGNDIYISWEDTTSGVPIYGVDKIDWNNKYNGAFFDTLVSKYSREYLDRYKKFIVNYESNPTSIDMQVNSNGGGFTDLSGYTPNPIINDTDRSLVVAETNIAAKTLQLRVSTTALGNNAPVIQDAMILME